MYDNQCDVNTFWWIYGRFWGMFTLSMKIIGSPSGNSLWQRMWCGPLNTLLLYVTTHADLLLTLCIPVEGGKLLWVSSWKAVMSFIFVLFWHVSQDSMKALSVVCPLWYCYFCQSTPMIVKVTAVLVQHQQFCCLIRKGRISKRILDKAVME